MKPQKVLLFDQRGADQDISALLIVCPICETEAGLWCGLVSSRGSSRESYGRIAYVHSLRARRGAGAARNPRSEPE